MGLTDIQPVVGGGKKGGGLFGSVLGGTLGLIAGAALAPVTAGASLGAAAAAVGAGALAGAGVGMGAGNLLGEVIDPTKAADISQSIGQIEGKKPKLAAMAAIPEVQLAQVNSAKRLIPNSSLPPETADSYMKMLDAADQRLKGRLGIGDNNG